MYLPTAHRFADDEALFHLMAAHPLGAWVCQAEGALVANHLPFVLDRVGGAHGRGRLRAHVARGNAIWRALGGGAPSVVLFQGPQAYISPGWYPGTATHGRVVPTWNYAVAHVHGRARAVDDAAWLRDLLQGLTATHEAGRPQPWQMADAPADYIAALLRAVVGIEITIDRVEGRLKASQDEAEPDRRGTVAGLRQAGGDAGRQMAEWVQQALNAEAGASAAQPAEPG